MNDNNESRSKQLREYRAIKNSSHIEQILS